MDSRATKKYRGSLNQGWHSFRRLHEICCNNKLRRDQSVDWHLWCRFFAAAPMQCNEFSFLLILMLCQWSPLPCTIHLPSVANFHLLSTPNSIASTEYCNNWRFMSNAKSTHVLPRASPVSVSQYLRLNQGLEQDCHCCYVGPSGCRMEQMTSRDVGPLGHVR